MCSWEENRIDTFIFRNSETIFCAIIIDMECAKSSLLEERKRLNLEMKDNIYLLELGCKLLVWIGISNGEYHYEMWHYHHRHGWFLLKRKNDFSWWWWWWNTSFFFFILLSFIVHFISSLFTGKSIELGICTGITCHRSFYSTTTSKFNVASGDIVNGWTFD